MALNVINKDKGDYIRLKVSYALVSPTTGPSTPVDPVSVNLFVKSPKQIGYSPSVQTTGVGAYHADLQVTEAGIWSYQWVSTGAAAGTEAGIIFVRDVNINI